MSRSSDDLGLESHVLILFLFGIALLVLGGSGYTATQPRDDSTDRPQPRSANDRSASAPKRTA